MNNRIFTAPFVFLSLLAAGQPRTFLSTLKPITIRIKNVQDLPDTPAGSFFSHFEVIDERSDTARIGIHTTWPAFSHPLDRQLVFRRPAATEIAGYLNEHFGRPGAPYTALI